MIVPISTPKIRAVWSAILQAWRDYRKDQSVQRLQEKVDAELQPAYVFSRLDHVVVVSNRAADDLVGSKLKGLTHEKIDEEFLKRTHPTYREYWTVMQDRYGRLMGRVEGAPPHLEHITFIDNRRIPHSPYNPYSNKIVKAHICLRNMDDDGLYCRVAITDRLPPRLIANLDKGIMLPEHRDADKWFPPDPGHQPPQRRRPRKKQ
jgi:hypothetical protein